MKPPKGKPCAACPMRRASAAGWLGAATPENFIASMHSDQPMPCHLAVDYTDPQWQEKLAKVPQCSGQGIYLSNVCHLPRPGKDVARTLPANRVLVFASRQEFLAHHVRQPPPKAKKMPAKNRATKSTPPPKPTPTKLVQKGEQACAYPGCTNEVDDADLCAGCDFYTCSDHSPHNPWGSHDVIDHWTGSDEDAEEGDFG